MSLTPKFLPSFWEDYEDRRLWYESRVPGLGVRFATVLERAIDRAVEFPEAYGRMQGRVRRVRLRPFQDLLFYRDHEPYIFFLGVVHGARDIPRWLDRRLREDDE